MYSSPLAVNRCPSAVVAAVDLPIAIVVVVVVNRRRSSLPVVVVRHCRRLDCQPSSSAHHRPWTSCRNHRLLSSVVHGQGALGDARTSPLSHHRDLRRNGASLSAPVLPARLDENPQEPRPLRHKTCLSSLGAAMVILFNGTNNVGYADKTPHLLPRVLFGCRRLQGKCFGEKVGSSRSGVVLHVLVFFPPANTT